MSEISKQTRLSQEEINRYSRHLILPEVGLKGQLKLKNSKVLVVGTGALGSPVLLYLSAAGIGTIGIIDFDTVDESNLQRQIIHSTNEIGNPKVNSAKSRINSINPNIDVIAYNDKLTSKNALEIIKNFDVVVDGTDNFQTRYLINDACVFLNKPFVYGAIFRFEGQSTVFNADKNSPCYRCIFPEPPKAGLVPSCSEAGVLGVLPGIIGTIQASEIKKDENCKVCGDNATIKELIDYEEFCGLKDSLQEIEFKELSGENLKELIDKKEQILLIDVRISTDFQAKNIYNSKNIPFEDLLNRVSEIDETKKVVLICTIGLKSKEAISKLKKAGYKGELYSLKGGITSWINDNQD